MERYAGIPKFKIAAGSGPGEAMEDLLSFFEEQNIGKPSYEELQEWLDKEGIELVEPLGAGRYGMALRVNSQWYGDDVVLKVSTHRNEMDCAKWIMKKGNKFNHLPQIFKLEKMPSNLDRGRVAFFYIRPYYEIDEEVIDYPVDRDAFTVKILKDTDYEFWPWDLWDNEGEDPKTGELVYFDPACELGFQAEEEIREFMLDRLAYYGSEYIEETIGLSVDDIRAFLKDDEAVDQIIEGEDD